MTRKNIEKLLEMRGMQRSEIVEYFLDAGAIEETKIRFLGQEFEVEISEEETISLGVIKVPRTLVLFRGNEEILDKVIAAFRLRFLSAGG